MATNRQSITSSLASISTVSLVLQGRMDGGKMSHLPNMVKVRKT